jgi:hypothetical protein
LILPFHFIVSAERDIKRGDYAQLIGLLSGNKLRVSLKGAVYPNLWVLGVLLIVLLAFSLAMTSRLLDYLQPGPYTNLFTQLVYLRGILFFGLALECLVWYHLALNRVKRKCLDHLNKAS